MRTPKHAEHARVKWYEHENLGTLLKIVGRDIERKPQWSGRIIGLELYGEKGSADPCVALTIADTKDV